MRQNISNPTDPDQSENSNIEALLADSQAVIAAILDTVIDGVVTINNQGSILSVNPALEKLFGYTRDELVGKNVRILMPSPDREQHDTYIANYFNTGVKKIIGIGREVIGQRKDGTVFPLDLAVTEVPLGNKMIFAGVLRDITRRKQAEIQLRKAHDELEQRVEERTSELVQTNEALKKEIEERKFIEKKLTNSLEEKEVLLREVHHRVKNNLQLISSLLNLHVRRLDQKTPLQILREIQDRIFAIALLHETLYQSNDMARVDFQKYVQALISSLLHSSGALGKIKANIDVAPLVMDLDSAIICGLLISELASNALKHAFQGMDAGEITVNAEQNNNGQITLMVRDNGRGLPSDIDLENATSLGLQLISKLSKKLRGDIELRCSPGTTFIISFLAS